MNVGSLFSGIGGLDSSGKRCKGCRFVGFHRPSRKRYWKCGLRTITWGPGTDHRVNWNACAKFEPIPAEGA